MGTDADAAAEFDRVVALVSNWGRWGPDDQLGTLNTITPEKITRAAALVRSGKVVSLAFPFDDKGPATGHGHRFNPIHAMLRTGTDAVAQGSSEAFADDIIIMPLQCSTQWDALAHCFDKGQMYGGRSAALVNARGAAKNGIENLARSVATRGVLLDVARHRGVRSLAPGEAIHSDDLEAVARREGVHIEPGDALLVRTGHLGQCNASGSWRLFTEGDTPGLSWKTVEWLRDQDIAAVASDTRAVEVMPSAAARRLPLHVVGLVYMGLLLGEIFNLDELADACARYNAYEFFFVAPPLPVTGAVGSPVNPYAIL
jgi:kynurenine formamidase